MSGSLGETMAIIASIDPADAGSSTTSSGYASMANFGRVTAIFNLGVLTGGTYTCVLQQATSSGGGGVKTLKTATALTASDDDKQVVISADVSDMDLAGGFNHVRATVTISGGSVCFASAVVLGFETRFAPTTSLDEASVAEVVEA